MRAQSITAPLPQPLSWGVIHYPQNCTRAPPAPLWRPCIKHRLLGCFNFLTLRDADVMVSTANSIALFEALPNAKLSIFPDASHGGIFQYADTFVDQTLRFLAE